MSELSIFIDESGDLGSNSEYYLLTLVFHEQQHELSAGLRILERHLEELGLLGKAAIHSYPIIRREDEYENMSLQMRRKIFSRLLGFARKSGVRFHSVILKKKNYLDREEIKERLKREWENFFREHRLYFTSFNRVIAYYDNGQALITELVVNVFTKEFFEVDFRKVRPADYRLFQVADLICTLELLRVKVQEDHLTRSEQLFFENKKKLKKDYLKQIEMMRF